MSPKGGIGDHTGSGMMGGLGCNGGHVSHPISLSLLCVEVLVREEDLRRGHFLGKNPE